LRPACAGRPWTLWSVLRVIGPLFVVVFIRLRDIRKRIETHLTQSTDRRFEPARVRIDVRIAEALTTAPAA
jgi:hypothetical protein